MPSELGLNIVCYTAIFGGIKDRLYPPGGDNDGVRFVAFVDDPSAKAPDGWKLRGAVESLPNKRRQARWHKTHPHKLFPAADYTLWIDGCLTPRYSVRLMIEECLQGRDLCVFKHGERSCLYQELEACLRLRKDDPQVMRRQVDEYRRQGYPYLNGLAETTAVLRRHISAIEQFDECWWREIRNGSLRDQLSFDYVCRCSGISYSHFPGSRTSSPYFRWRAHR